MKLHVLLLVWIGFFITLLITNPVGAASGVVGTGTPASCTEAAFDTALSGVLSSHGTLSFDCGSAPYTLTVTSPKHITASITIDGGGLITLSGGGTTTILELLDDVPLLTIQNITIANGYATPAGPSGVCRNNACGGGIRGHYRASLAVINCLFINNIASATSLVKPTSLDFGGGAIYLHSGTLTVENSQFLNNRAQNGSGGAIHVLHSNVVISDSLFDSNYSDYYGGAFYGDGLINSVAGNHGSGFVQFTDTTFINNSSLGQGGAIFNYMYVNQHSNSLAKYQNVRFINNSVGVDFVGDAYGGALRIGNGPAQIYNTTFSGNTAQKAGGAIWTGEAASVLVANSTFYNNDAIGVNVDDGYGGAIYVASSRPFALTNVTIANNHAGQLGGGIWSKGSNVSLVNDVVANNTATNPWNMSQNCDRGYSGVRNSIQWPVLSQSDKSCGSGITFADPLLGPLALNEGTTETMALQVGSPAVDGADSSYCQETDQRGRFRTFDGDWDGKGLCDIGAYELVAFNVPSAVNAPPYRNVFTAAGATIAWGRVSWGVGYEIQLDNNPDFSSVNKDIIVNGAIFTTTTGSLQEGVYYWRIRARDASGHWGGWSTSDSFLITP